MKNIVETLGLAPYSKDMKLFIDDALKSDFIWTVIEYKGMSRTWWAMFASWLLQK